MTCRPYLLDLVECRRFISRCARDIAGRRLGNKKASFFASLGSFCYRTLRVLISCIKKQKHGPTAIFSFLVECRRFELLTYWLRTNRSTNWANTPSGWINYSTNRRKNVIRERFGLFLDGSSSNGLGGELLMLYENCDGYEQCDRDNHANHANHPKVWFFGLFVFELAHALIVLQDF